MEQLKEQSTDKEYDVTTKTLGMYQNYSFLLPTLELLVEQRKKLKISLNKMSKDLYGNRYYVNYLSKIEKGEIPNVSYEVIARIHTYLGEIEYQQNKK
jgi:predicted transcriptional regulator